MSLEAGSRVGRYEIRAPLGKGGMGEVYRAHDPQLGRDVALKILPVEVASDAERMRRFVQEAKAASSLNHPNILTVHEIGEQDSTRFIAAELVAGVTLRERLARGPMELAEALDVAAQSASALAAAHAAGVVHRDVKPENLMLRPDGYVKVLDFGLAKVAPLQASADAPTQTGLLTEAGVVMGTARYMSPEQACGLPVDARTDVWSLGVVLYEMVAGRMPFEGATTGEVLGAIATQGEAPPLHRFAPDAPAELERIAGRALAKNREERYHSMQDMALDLKELRQKLDFEAKVRRATPTSGEPPAPAPPAMAASTDGAGAGPVQPSVRFATRRRAALLFVVVAAAAVAAFAYLRLARNAPAAIDSLAVLPLAAPDADADTELLADGITESLINSLSQLPDLRVIARPSVFRYKGRDVEPLQAARELDVRAVVTGRVAQRGDQLQIGVELTDARENRHLWGQQFTPRFADLLTVQQEISGEISQQLRQRLTSEQKSRVGKQHTENVEAYKLNLQGRHYFYRFPRPEYHKSREYFQRAIDLDPSYAPPYAGLADYYGFAANNGLLPPAENWAKGEAALRKALELDPELPEARNSLAATLVFLHGDWAGAERELRRNRERNPNFPGVLYGTFLSCQGRIEESLAEMHRSRELDPLSSFFQRRLGSALYLFRRYAEAIPELQKALELDPGDPWAHRVLGDAYERAGRAADAVKEWSTAMTLSGSGELAALLERTYAESGFDTALKALARARLEQLHSRAARGDYVPAIEFVYQHLRLGEREPAFEWLAKAEQERNRMLLEIGVDPIFDPIRDDPRFVELLRRLGLPSAPPVAPVDTAKEGTT
jgi:serine/threonine-protein kinase